MRLETCTRVLACAAALALGFSTLRGAPEPPSAPYGTWSEFAGSADSMQYLVAEANQQDQRSQLQLAFFYPAPGHGGRFAFGPLVVDDVMYVVGKDATIAAIDAGTGKEIWSHAIEGAPTNRGFNYWESRDRRDRRLIFSASS